MQILMNKNGTVPLRRNVIYRDWRNGINKYRFAGFVPEEVYMNFYMFNILMNYIVAKVPMWSRIERRLNTTDVYDSCGVVIGRYNTNVDTYFEGIKILIDNSMENETMRAVW